MTAKSELKRLCTLDPMDMAKRLALAEAVVEAARTYMGSRRVVAKELDWDMFEAMELAIADYDQAKGARRRNVVDEQELASSPPGSKPIERGLELARIWAKTKDTTDNHAMAVALLAAVKERDEARRAFDEICPSLTDPEAPSRDAP